MKILAQKRIWKETHYDQYLEALRQFGHEVTEVEIVPFTKIMLPEPDFTPDLVLGSGRLTDVARERGWNVFKGFDPVEFYPRMHYINGFGTKMTVAELDWMLAELKWRGCFRNYFVKPFREKLFTGKVVDDNKPLDAQIQFSTSEVSSVEDEDIWVSSVQNILWEERYAVIGGEVITGSEYKRAGDASYAEVRRGESALWDYATSLVRRWGVPDRAFTLDVCMMDNGPGIVELNNFNSAGMYLCDGNLIAHALTDIL